MPSIHVCSLLKLPDEAERLKPARLITLLSPFGVMPERPPHLEPQQHLTRLFHDINDTIDDLTPPSQADVQAVIDFARSWANSGDKTAPLLIHCFAGVSRSTAAALISAVAVNPSLDDDALARGLRAASPTASPNLRMISMADLLLGRGGRLIDAVMDMTGAAFVSSTLPFQLPTQ